MRSKKEGNTMPSKGQTLRQVLQQELFLFTDRPLRVQVDDLLDPVTAKNWLITLLAGAEEDAAYLQNRIQMTPDRLFHVISTYLLGNAVRRRLGLGFESLPRIFSPRTNLDSFGFFWAVTCLCHDLGYQYEVIPDDACRAGMLKQMETPSDRQALLGITYDLLTFTEKEIDLFPSGWTAEERQWILDALTLIGKYDVFRRKEHKCIDHGVAGGLLLCDMLIQLTGKHSQIRQLFRGQNTDVRPVLGEISANSGHKRFAACALLIACTVARHNIWTNSDPMQKDTYAKYHLQELCFEPGQHPQTYVDFNKGTEQMLFFLGMMDTLDPVKGFGLRPWLQEVDFRTILDRVLLTEESASPDGKHQTFGIRVDNTGAVFQSNLLAAYHSGWKSIPDWLNTKPPVLESTYLRCYFPAQPPREWPYGITEEEIRALCLYEGDMDGSRAEAFWRTPNAYQTINLLMMEGTEGEEIRVCRENQYPHGLYLENWQTTLEVLCHIFNAQLKYRPKSPLGVCYRVERAANFSQMQRRGQTISCFSTCQDRYLEHLASQKEGLLLLEVKAECGVPFVDYQEILGHDYLYFDEKEVLFPPFVPVTLTSKVLDTDKQYPHGRNDKEAAGLYEVSLTAPKWEKDTDDETALTARLERDKGTAAQVLRTIRNQRSLEGIPQDELKLYIDWKTDFQKLVYLRLKALNANTPSFAGR